MAVTARIAMVVVGAALLALPTWAQDRRRDQPKKMNAQELKRTLGEGDRLLAEGNPLEARKYFMAVIEQDPGNLPASLKLARASEQIQDWDGAIGAYTTVASRGAGAEKAEGHAGLAAAYARTGQFREAADNARQAIQLNDAAAGAHATLAYSLVRLGSMDEALASAEKAMALAPSSALAHVALGEALLAAGRAAEAEAPLRKALELDPKSADAHAAIADIQFRGGDHAAAVASASKALEMNSQVPRAYLVRGKANHARGQMLLAESDLAAGLKGDPSDVDAHLALAQILRSSNRSQAASAYQRLLEIDSTNGTAYLELADISVKKNDYASARPHIERAVERLPDSARAHHLKAVILEHQRELDAALEAYTRAAELDPKLVEAHYGRGKILRDQKKDIAGAVASLQAAADLSPSNAAILTDLGVVLYDAKQVDKAGEVLSRAVATPDYKNPIGFGVLGLVHKDAQKFADALGWFDKAAGLTTTWWLPHWGAAWSHFGLIKKGCPCDPEDEVRVRKIKEHYDQMVALKGSDPALEQRVEALVKGQKVK